jgi:hypothetical protein
MPAGDVYVLCRVLHNWPDDDCVRLLRRIRGATAAGGRVIVVEDLGQRDAPGGQVMDLLILLMLSGCDRSEDEYAGLLGAAGFAVRAVHPPRGRSAESAIEAVPA